MSTYNDYEALGNFYDEARLADGVEMMCGMMTIMTGKSMAEVSNKGVTYNFPVHVLFDPVGISAKYRLFD